MTSEKLQRLADECSTLAAGTAEMQTVHNEYLKELNKLYQMQEERQKAVKHSLYRFRQVNSDLLRLESEEKDLPESDKKLINDLKKQMIDTKQTLEEMKGELPIPENGWYLSTILGSNLNLSLLNKKDRYRYKEEYEKFKASVTLTVLAMFTLALIFPSRLMDALCFFLLVWYYCTLTIREAILSINGSRIKGWWIIHHYFSTIHCGLTLTWRDGECYQAFRVQFLIFCLYIAVVQLFQSQYQKGCLRRLRALGERHSMDITVEGFSSWMFRGLTFLIPFLVLAYIFQFYNSYVLYKIWTTYNCTGEWQVIALSILFFLIACGNSITLSRVVVHKWSQSGLYATNVGLTTKYRSNPVQK
uniref:Transmembrane protein 120 homolog n=1 Tax=Syphacia muris TaxID=451379 RepID=A0A0N5AJ67_9BILA